MLTGGAISQLNKIGRIHFNLDCYEKIRLFEVNFN